MEASNFTTPEGKIYHVDLGLKHFAILRPQTMWIDRPLKSLIRLNWVFQNKNSIS